MPQNQINHVTDWQCTKSNGDCTIAVTTELPATPQMFTTCSDPINIPKEQDKEGKVVPHGYKKWVPNLEGQDDPTVCAGNKFIWAGPCGCPDGAPCNKFVAELGAAAPTINWDSLIHPCDDCDQADAAVVAGPTSWGEGGDGTWVRPLWGTWSDEPPLEFDGGQVVTPDHGHFQVTAYTQWEFPEVPGTAQLRVIDAASGAVLALTDPQGPADDDCSGSVATTPKLPIRGAAMHIEVQIAGDVPDAKQFRMIPSNGFIVTWYDD